ncbi:uncharacterized protein crebzf isoform 2-T3 [Pholidichthys leucotaenia]
MITRRRSRATNTRMQEVEVADATETQQDVPLPSDELLVDNISATGIELEDLFGIEDLKWTLEEDASSPLLDIELDYLDMYSAKDQDSRLEASPASSSPERMSSEPKMKSRQIQSSNTINKNAIAARLNRLKKKEYVNSLERKIGILSTENCTLKQENSQLTKRVEELEDETRKLTQTTMIMHCPGSV